MADRFGIITRYHQHEATYAAIHLAQMALESGMPVSILGLGDVRREVALAWDSKVVTPKQIHPHRWARECSRVLWTHVPPYQDVMQANEMGIDTVLLVSWEEITEDDRRAVASCNKVILPHRCVAHSLQRKWRLSSTNPILMPWDVPIPITKKITGDSPHSDLVAYFPMYDSQPHRIDQAIFKVMDRILAEVDNASILISIGRGWSMSSRKLMKALRKQYPGRVVIEPQPNMLKRILLFSRADITVWAPKFESFGLVGLTSLCMGTPVISWDVRPQREFLSPWKNSVLIPARTEENWLGVPEVKSGYGEFSDMLISSLKDKGLIATLKCGTSEGLEERRREFEAGWKEVQR